MKYTVTHFSKFIKAPLPWDVTVLNALWIPSLHPDDDPTICIKIFFWDVMGPDFVYVWYPDALIVEEAIIIIYLLLNPTRLVHFKSLQDYLINTPIDKIPR